MVKEWGPGVQPTATTSTTCDDLRRPATTCDDPAASTPHPLQANSQEAGFQHVPRSQPLRIDPGKGAKSVVPWQTARLATYRLFGSYHGVSAISSRFISTNSSFATIAEGYPWPCYKPYLASEPGINPQSINRYDVRPTFLSRLWRTNHNLLGFAETTG
jgi:hypothetical protein